MSNNNNQLFNEEEDENLELRIDLDKQDELELEVEAIEIDEESELFVRKLITDQKIYWGDEQEKAVEDFLNEESEAKKNIIFKQRLYKPFIKLIENIIFTYKLFRHDVDVKTLQVDCLSFVMTKFSNFEPSKSHKAFSYFGTVAKHYLMCEKKELYKSTKNTLDYDANQEEVNNTVTYEMSNDSPLDRSASLFNHILSELKKEIERKDISDNDRKVGDAIINIFENHEVLALYNKNVLYQIIKERTGLQTKEITYSLSRFRVFYRIIKQDFSKKEK